MVLRIVNERKKRHASAVLIHGHTPALWYRTKILNKIWM